MDWLIETGVYSKIIGDWRPKCMDYERIKKQANEILENGAAECSYIEYKASASQLDKILKTICAYGNNYYNNDIQYIFVGIEETNNENNKATPILPILGIEEGRIEKAKNSLNSLRPFLYPNVQYELITNEIGGRKYILLVVQRQTGGPFMVSDRAERDKKIHLKAGRYVRVEADSRLARVDEEFDLLRKFSNYHFSSISNTDATVDDLDGDCLREYISRTSNRGINESMNKTELAQMLEIVDKNDPTNRRIKNYGVLMFAFHPENFIAYSYTELIVDMFGTKRKMESKRFHGPIWKQYYTVLNYISDNYLNYITLREEGVADNRVVSNFTYVALEELLANVYVHNNYENGKPIQIYVSEREINIVNYNKPLPPLKISDLNERTFFNERDTENPEVRDMFKALGIIESFGTGIGEAKRSMEANGSPSLYYKQFDVNTNVTSVVLPVNEEYFAIKNGGNPQIKQGIEHETLVLKAKVKDSGYTQKIKDNIMLLYNTIGSEVFGNARVMEILNCSESTATTYIKRMNNEIEIIAHVEGQGKGKYKFL